ncbi:MAG: UbiA family prenyltransferase [Pauljensenia sp.]
MSGQHVASTPPLTLGMLRAWKPHVQPAIVLPVLVGATTAGQSRPAPMDWLVAACVGFFYMGGVSALNDVFDLERDKVNHPNRPLTRGDLSLRHYVMGLVIAPVVISLLLLLITLAPARGLLVVGILCLIEVMHLVYCLHPNLGMAGFGRQLLLTVGPMLLVLVGGLGHGLVTSRLILCAVSIGLFFGSGIILKDLSDIPGDQKSGLVTLPIHWGRNLAVKVSCFGQLVATSLGYTYLILVRASVSVFGWMTLSLVMSLTGTMTLLHRKQRYWGPGMLMAYTSQFIFELALILSNKQ